MKKNKIKPKQIAAIIAIVLLVAMYLASLFVAIFDKSHSLKMLMASVAVTVIVPIFLWLFIQTYQYITRNRKENQEVSKTKGPISVNGVEPGVSQTEASEEETADEGREKQDK